MKKIRLLLIAFALLTAFVSFGQTQLTFRFANPRIVYYDGTSNFVLNTVGDYFEFDIQIKASDLTTLLFSGQANLSFNNAYLSSNASDWYVKRGALTTQTLRYNLTIPTVTTGPTANIGWEGLNPNTTNLAGYAPVTGAYQTVVTVYVRIINALGTAGLDFVKSSMDATGVQSYKVSGGYSSYASPNLYDAGNFNDTYLGRIYSALGWSQIGGATDNAQYTNWTTSVNTSVWDGAATIPTTGVSLASNLRVHSPATLTIPNTGQITVTGATEINTVNGLTIQSDATGTGSLITGTASGTGSTIAQRWMTAGKWNIVSSPLSGQTVANFLSNNPDNGTTGIALKSGNRGILEFLPLTNAWSLASPTGPAGNLAPGKGFSMRLPGLTPVTNDASVTFNGALQATSVNPTVAALASVGYWNCIGNPFTSAIRLTSNTAQTNFLTANAASLVSGSGIYVWEASDINNGQNGHYTTYSNAVGGGDFQQGQAFMVNVTASPLSFTSAMQIHSTGLALKSTGSVWPTIKLEATAGKQKSSTIIAFNSSMTKGLDPTYDASLLKGSTDLLVYSRLVEDNGIPFAIQALPDNDFSNMIIPIGIDSKTGGEVVFSAELMNLSSDCNVILEDKLNKTFTDLSEKDYTVTIAANSSISDRFQLHTSDLTTGITDGTTSNKLNAFAIRNIEIRVKGNVSKQAVATLYDIQGRAVVVKNLEEGSLNIIPTPNIKTGIYMLYVKDNGNLQGFKIPVTE